MRHAGQVVTRTMLLESVWEYHFDPQTNVIDVHISRLRAKIDKGFETPLLHTDPRRGLHDPGCFPASALNFPAKPTGVTRARAAVRAGERGCRITQKSTSAGRGFRRA